MSKQQSIRTVFLVVVACAFAQGRLSTGAGSSHASLDSLKAHAKDSQEWIQLGYAYLNAGDFDNAKKVFRRETRGDSAAAAYNGLGVLYSQHTRAARQEAFEYFRRALAVDPKYMEARVNIARLHLKMGNLAAEQALKDVIEADSTYAPGYLMLADWYKDSLYYDRRIALYEQYLRLRPGDTEALYGLAMTYIEQHCYTPVLEVLNPAFEALPLSPRFIPLAAQAYAATGDPDRAIELFQEYFDSLSEEERALYEDLALVAFPDEFKTYNATPDEEREEFLDRFWQRRDMALVSGGRAREAEHYRRVWYARTFFGEKVFPWDRRGEVYIRYGEPDYRARSNRANAVPPSPAVQRIRDLNSQEIIGVFDAKSDLEEPKGWDANPLGEPEGWVLKPFGEGLEEEWVYTNVAGGLQLKFVDALINGDWDFPGLAELHESRRATFQMMAFHPAAVYNRVIRKIPEYHGVPPGVEPLDFYYDSASFRGRARGMEKVELYFGVPLGQIASEQSAGQKISKVKMAVALLDVHGEETHRSDSDLAFLAIDPQMVKKGTFVPDVVPIEVPPGDYRLAVQLVDQVSGKWGIYMQDLSVPDYADSLAISDLELAWNISKAPRQGKFRKGDLWVTPIPSRSYRSGQNIHVYYELYNLSKDRYGQTRYRVSYAIKRDIRRGSSVLGTLAAMTRNLVSTREGEVVVSYERTGQEPSEPVYFELDGRTLKAGLSLLEVSITDLNRRTSISKSVIFNVEESARD